MADPRLLFVFRFIPISAARLETYLKPLPAINPVQPDMFCRGPFHVPVQAFMGLIEYFWNILFSERGRGLTWYATAFGGPFFSLQMGTLATPVLLRQNSAPFCEGAKSAKRPWKSERGSEKRGDLCSNHSGPIDIFAAAKMAISPTRTAVRVTNLGLKAEASGTEGGATRLGAPPLPEGKWLPHRGLSVDHLSL